MKVTIRYIRLILVYMLVFCAFSALHAQNNIPTPTPTWRPNLYISGDTVYDTICRRMDAMDISVESKLGTETITYTWEIKGNVTKNDESSYVPETDGIFPIKYTPAIKLADIIYIKVTANSGTNTSKPLFIRLFVTDVVELSTLGSIIPLKDGMSLNTQEPCPSSVISFRVENEKASPSYKWTLPSDWEFLPETRQDSSYIYVIVGTQAGKVTVAPITDPNMLYCNYVDPNPIETPEYTPKELPMPKGWENEAAMNLNPCPSVIVNYGVEPLTEDDTDVEMYRWEFPEDWEISGYGYVHDTAKNIYMGPNRECSVKVGEKSGKIRVYAVLECDGQTIWHESKSLEKDVVLKSGIARIDIEADENVCLDSVLVVNIHRNADVEYMNFFASYEGPDQTQNQIKFAADSSFLEMKCSNKDKVTLLFVPSNKLCPSATLTAIKEIKADTVPTINGQITGKTKYCHGEDIWLSARADMDDDKGNVSYRWELPNYGDWKFLSRSDSSSVHIQVVSSTYARGRDTIRCYPRALCGTAIPYELEIETAARDTLRGVISYDNPRPCSGSEVKYTISGNFSSDYKFIWSVPEDWKLLSTDSTSTATIEVKKGLDSIVSVSVLRSESCGLSLPVSRTIQLRDIPEEPSLKDFDYPCATSNMWEFRASTDAYTDTVIWSFNETGVNPLVFNSQTGVARGDSITMPSFGHTDHNFSVKLIAKNTCGTHEATMLVHPVGSISNFESQIEYKNFCLSDTAHCYIAIPEEQKNKGTKYFWAVDSINTYIDTRIEDAYVVLEFLASELDTTTQVKVYAQNACNKSAEVTTDVKPHTYWVRGEYVPYEGATVVNYGDAVQLNVKQVEGGDKSAYTYTWEPSDRLIFNRGATVATDKLVKETEEFILTAKEDEDNSATQYFLKNNACVSHDTVKIPIVGTFYLGPDIRDTLCMEDDIDIKVRYRGGGGLDSSIVSITRIVWDTIIIADAADVPEPDEFTNILVVPDTIKAGVQGESNIWPGQRKRVPVINGLVGDVMKLILSIEDETNFEEFEYYIPVPIDPSFNPRDEYYFTVSLDTIRRPDPEGGLGTLFNQIDIKLNVTKDTVAHTPKYSFFWHKEENGVYRRIGSSSPYFLLYVTDTVNKFMVVGRDTTILYYPDSLDDYGNRVPKYIYNKVDTQYIEFFTINLDVDWVQPGIADTYYLGALIPLEVNVSGGSGRYQYHWWPESQFGSGYDPSLNKTRTRPVHTIDSLGVVVTDLARIEKVNTMTDEEYWIGYGINTGDKGQGEGGEVIPQSLIMPRATEDDEAEEGDSPKERKCQKTSHINVLLQEYKVDPNAPNAFTPNGDGYNDLFMEGWEIYIYNRQGDEVYRNVLEGSTWSDPDAPTGGWNGTHRRNKHVVSKGDYLYRIKTDRHDADGNLRVIWETGVVTVF